MLSVRANEPGKNSSKPRRPSSPLLAPAGMLSGRWLGLGFYAWMDSGKTSTTQRPANRGPDWRRKCLHLSGGKD
jgi:hypothetical protein